MEEYCFRMWNFFRNASALIADLGGAVFTLISLTGGIILAYQYSKTFVAEHLSIFVVAISVVFLSLIFTLRSLKNSFTKVRNEYRRQIVDNKLKAIEEPNEQGAFNPESGIPSNILIKQIYSIILEEAMQWSSDAVLDSHNLYIDAEGGKTSIQTQAYFVSLWKKEELTIYYPMESRNFAKLDLRDGKGTPLHEFPMWREAVTAAYQKVSSRMPKNFKITIHSSGSKSISIHFLFINGKINDMIKFNFTDNVLTCRDDKSTRIIK